MMGTNLKDLETKFAKAKNELKVFEKLDSGEKIMKEQTTNILYSDPPDNFQFIRRWWAGENWKKTIEHLDEVFGSFTKFLDQILKFAQINGLGPVYKFINRVCEYINKIIPGLHTLKYTYSLAERKEIHAKIDAIILTLIDFKDEIYKQKSRAKRNNSHQLRRSFEC